MNTKDLLTPGRRILITGPSRTGKTLTCARALTHHVATHGPEGVVVLEFAPRHIRVDGTVIGERLDHYERIPDGVHHRVVETRAPRASATRASEAIEIAKTNAKACAQALRDIIDPRALFVNDVTMAYHVPGTEPSILLEHLERADIAILTALDPVGFPLEHPITMQERSILKRLMDHVDEVVHTTPIPRTGTPPQRRSS